MSRKKLWNLYLSYRDRQTLAKLSESYAITSAEVVRKAIRHLVRCRSAQSPKECTRKEVEEHCRRNHNGHQPGETT